MPIKGAKEHIKRLKYLQSNAALKNIEKALFVGGELIANEAGLSITRGAVSGKGHVPSAPGEPPNADTHRLDRSIETNKVGPLVVQVSANSGYASALEFGTSKVAARPFMRPARDKKKKQVNDLVQRAMNENMAKGGR